MKSKFTLLLVAIATIFTSCSKEANFTHSGTNFGGYHKMEQNATAKTETSTPETDAVTASTETIPAATKQTPALTASKTAKTEVASAETTEAAVATAAATMSKKEVKAVAKQLKKDIKKNKENKAEGKSQIIALILALAVGWVSAHRFYLGYTKIAIFQILSVLACGIGLIWVLIDIIRILTGDLQPNGGTYEKTL